MAEISAKQVMNLRQRTGLGVMECKKALLDSDCDTEQAIALLRTKSGLKAAQKSGRITADGMIIQKISEARDFAVMMEINCETDFVARDEIFRAFAGRAADEALRTKATDVAALMSDDLETARTGLIQKTGENISLRRLELVNGQPGSICSYVHSNHRIGVLLSMTGGDAPLGRDIAMHITALSPRVVKPQDMPADILENERKIFSAQAMDSGKPPQIVKKMVEGKLKKFLNEQSLLSQPFIKNPDQKVGELLSEAGASVQSFVRYEIGEGLGND